MGERLGMRLGEAGNEAGGEAGNEAGGEAGNEAGGEAGNEAGGEAGNEAGGEAGNEAGGEAENEAGAVHVCWYSACAIHPSVQLLFSSLESLAVAGEAYLARYQTEMLSSQLHNTR